MTASESSTPSTSKSHQAVRRVLLFTLAANVLVSLLKLGYGYWANIVSLQADGFHSLFDALSNVIGLVALGLAMQPPDPEHPYGHQKLEVAASLVIGVMILLGLLEVGRGVWSAAVEGVAPNVGPAGYGVVGLTIASSLFVSFYERSAAKKYDSMILASDADHTLTDALAGLSVLGGMALVSFGIPAGDILAALAVMGFIGMAAYRVLRKAIDVVVDAALLDAEVVCDLVESIEEVDSCHYVRSRGMPDNVHLDLHVTMSPDMKLSEAGDVLLRIRDLLHEHFAELEDVLIQIEPHEPVHYDDVPEKLV